MNNNRNQFWLLYIVAIALLLASFIALRFLLPVSLLFDAEWRGISPLYQYLLSDMWGWALVITLFVSLATLLLTTLGLWLLRKVKPMWLLVVAWAISLGAAMGIWGVFPSPSTNDRFKTLMVLSGQEDWQGVIDYTNKYPCSSYLEYNIRNLALAETGQLIENFRQQSNRSVQYLFVMKVETPYVSAMLSDIYWSMGEISMSQMYAFEANEKLGNYSPRLLKRLVQTNLVYGYYAVAAKYLTILSENTLNDDFVAHYSQLMNDEAVETDPLLGLKRRCIPKDNVFPSARSIPFDLNILLQQCPEARSAEQYFKTITITH